MSRVLTIWGERSCKLHSSLVWTLFTKFAFLCRRLDYFVLSNRLLTNLCESTMRTKVMGSDHCPIICELAMWSSPDLHSREGTSQMTVQTEVLGSLVAQWQSGGNIEGYYPTHERKRSILEKELFCSFVCWLVQYFVRFFPN